MWGWWRTVGPGGSEVPRGEGGDGDGGSGHARQPPWEQLCLPGTFLEEVASGQGSDANLHSQEHVPPLQRCWQSFLSNSNDSEG